MPLPVAALLCWQLWVKAGCLTTTPITASLSPLHPQQRRCWWTAARRGRRSRRWWSRFTRSTSCAAPRSRPVPALDRQLSDALRLGGRVQCLGAADTGGQDLSFHAHTLAGAHSTGCHLSSPTHPRPAGLRADTAEASHRAAAHAGHVAAGGRAAGHADARALVDGHSHDVRSAACLILEHSSTITGRAPTRVWPLAPSGPSLPSCCCRMIVTQQQRPS